MDRSPPAAPYCAFPNRFRQDLRAGRRQIGCWCSLANPYSTEILGIAGFDWLLLDAEHAPNDIGSLVLQLMALKDSASAPVVRPQWNDGVVIKRLLDAGFHNFLIPFVETADEARAAVAATRYPPRGIRGVSVAMRGNRFGTVKDYHAGVADDNVAVIVQIESAKAVAQIDEICRVDGVDAVFVGPSDLSASLGHLGDSGHPEVADAIGHVISRAKAAGTSVGILTPVEAEARRYLELGVTLLAVGSDQGAFRSATQALRDRFND
ncbi:MAG TPA: 2-dehydro-3-deoxyglucarate aldolase [Burkholderiaceae bacterium]|nr:2-dehydro-3-deoxyglucarate aldolase [Burkholderiaceae bacterium]